MKSGRLIDTITIERGGPDQVNAAGAPTKPWAQLCTLRAERVEFTTEELIRGFGAADEDEVLFRCRFFDGLANADRVIWNGNIFNIKKVTPIGRRKGMELRCERIVT